MAGYKVQIYAVDDDMLYLRLLGNQIRKNTPYPVEVFTNGEDCLAHYKAHHPKPNKIAVVILDYMLATREQENAQNGLVILEKLLNYDKNAKVIMLSGIPDVNIAKKAIDKGAINYIPKNENSFIRIHNTIQHLISEKKVESRKKYSKQLLWLFLGLLFMALVGLMLAYLRYPGWFYYGFS
jgi:DNA-binding NtrC family response regulator